MRAILNDTRFRFLLVGGWNTFFGYALFWLLYGLFSRTFEIRYVAYTSAQVVGWVIAVLVAYVLHKRFTFRSTAKGSAAWAEFFRFMQTYVAMFLFGLAFLPFLVEIVGLDPRIAALVATAAGVVISYVGHRFRTFRQQDHQS